MKKYSYIGVVDSLFDYGCKFIVRSADCPIYEGNIVAFTVNRQIVHAEVLHSAFLPIGGEEEAMLAEFGEVYEVDKVYGLAWEKKEEVTEDGN